MLIYHREVPLQDGFQLLRREKKDRLVYGKQVSQCSGWALFDSLSARSIACWDCGCVADRWIANKGRRDFRGSAVLDLYASRDGLVTLMTRDHIIPKSLGGSDDVENLRPGCEVCNGARGNRCTSEELQFRQDHPHLVSEARYLKARQRAIEMAFKHPHQADYILEPYNRVDRLTTAREI